jgi:hypothetical protein
MYVHVLMVRGFILRNQAVYMTDVKMKALQSTDTWETLTQRHSVTFKKTESSATWI